MKLKNFQMEVVLNDLKPFLSRRDKIGYMAARNTRILSEALTEYLAFKEELIKKYGEPVKDDNGDDTQMIGVNVHSPKFEAFTKEFDKIKDIEHDVALMTLKYDETIGILSGEEILKLDKMLVD